MEIKVLKRDKGELRVEVVGESHSFCNILQNFLLKDDSVEFAGYDLPHPLVGNPVLYLRTKGKRKPETALTDAAESLRENLEKIRKTFLNVWEKEERSTKSDED